MGFYACPVPAFEQYTLAKFISEGYFERHINRLRKHYRKVRETVLKAIGDCKNTEIREENAGLHFILKINGDPSDIIRASELCGITITPLSEYYSGEFYPENVYALNYSNADTEETEAAFKALSTK